MNTPLLSLILIGLAIVTVWAIQGQVEGLKGRGVGMAMMWLGLVGLPILALARGFDLHLEGSKRTDFCTSCHEMKAYGRSMHIDDKELLPAVHFQNRLVDRQTACFTCHRDYAMFGDLTTKLAGVQHLWVHYFGEIPEEMKLYKPYANENCLSCHRGARSFGESRHHRKRGVDLASVTTGTVSCLDSKCHDLGHGLDDLEDADLWGLPQGDTP